MLQNYLNYSVWIRVSFKQEKGNKQVLQIRVKFQHKKKRLRFGARINNEELFFFLSIGVPGGLVGGPRAYQDQVRGFKSHRVHARKGFFLHARN